MTNVGDLTLSAKAARVEAECGFGERFRALVAKSGVSVVDAARSMGIRREDLYEVFDSQKHMRAAWWELTPPAVEKLHLADRAAFHGLELTPVAGESVTFAAAATHFGAALAQLASSESDGVITADEATADLDAIVKLETALAGMRAARAKVLDRKGLRAVVTAVAK